MARSNSTYPRYDKLAINSNNRYSPYDDLEQYVPSILERTPAYMAAFCEERSTIKASSKNKGRGQAKPTQAQDVESAALAQAHTDLAAGEQLDAQSLNQSYPSIIKYSDCDGGYVRKRASIEYPYMMMFMQSYLDSYSDLIYHLISCSDDREEVEVTLQELLRNYHGVLMNEYRTMFYTMLACAPKVLFIMLRFDFWRDLILTPHDLVVELDLHRQLRQANEEYNQIVEDYEKRVLTAKNYAAKAGKAKHFTVQDAERLERLKQYHKLKNNNKPIPKSLLVALAKDEQEILAQEQARIASEEKRHFAALKSDYRPLKSAQDTPEAAAVAAYTQNKAALEANNEYISQVDTLAQAAATDNTADLDAETLAAAEAAAEAIDAEAEADAKAEADTEAAETETSGKTRGKKKTANTKSRSADGSSLGYATFKAKGTRNLNTSYMLLQKLALTPTTGPLDARNKRDNLPKLGRGHYRRTPLPQTFEIRRTIDSVADLIERDRETMFASLMSLGSNQARLKTLYGDNFKRFNLLDPNFEDTWLNLETKDQPCVILFVGTCVEVRPHNTKRSVYSVEKVNRHFVVLDGIDFRVNSAAHSGRSKNMQRAAAAAEIAAANAAKAASSRASSKADDDSEDNTKFHFNVIREEQLSSYELIYIKL